MSPRLLDLFCGAGGAARGYQRAGFHVTGIDITLRAAAKKDKELRDVLRKLTPHIEVEVTL